MRTEKKPQEIETFHAEYTVRVSTGNLCILLTAWVPNRLISSKDVEIRFIVSSAMTYHKTLLASGPMVIYDDPGTGMTLYGAVVEEGRPGVSSAFKYSEIVKEKLLTYQVLITRKGALLRESDPEGAVIEKSPEYFLDIIESLQDRSTGAPTLDPEAAHA